MSAHLHEYTRIQTRPNIQQRACGYYITIIYIGSYYLHIIYIGNYYLHGKLIACALGSAHKHARLRARIRTCHTHHTEREERERERERETDRHTSNPSRHHDCRSTPTTGSRLPPPQKNVSVPHHLPIVLPDPRPPIFHGQIQIKKI